MTGPERRDQDNTSHAIVLAGAKPLAELTHSQRLAMGVVNLSAAQSDREFVGFSIQVATALTVRGALQRVLRSAYHHPGLFSEPDPRHFVAPNLKSIRERFSVLTGGLLEPAIEDILTSHPGVAERVQEQLQDMRLRTPGSDIRTSDVLFFELINAANLPITEDSFVRIVQGHAVYESIIDRLESRRVFSTLEDPERSSLIALGQRLGRPVRILRVGLDENEGAEEANHQQIHRHASGLATQLRVLSQLTRALAESDDEEDRQKLMNIRDMIKQVTAELERTDRDIRKGEHPGAPQLSRAEQLHRWWE